MHIFQGTVVALCLSVVFVFFCSTLMWSSSYAEGEFLGRAHLQSMKNKTATCSRCGKCSWCRVGNKQEKGKVVKPMNRYPWMVALRHKSGSFVCGGAIISATFIITSAHCLINFNKSGDDRCEGYKTIPKDCFISADDVDVSLLGEDGFLERIGVKKIVPHPQFDQRRIRHDIALVQLASSIPCNKKVFPICLPTRDYLKLNRNILVTGWEKQWANHSKKPTELLESTLKQYPSKMCHLEDSFNDITYTICTAGRKKKETPCMGDAGSVAVAKFGKVWLLLGIKTFDVKFLCKVELKFPIYSRVFHYVPWIVKQVKDISQPTFQVFGA